MYIWEVYIYLLLPELLVVVDGTYGVLTFTRFLIYFLS